MKTAPVDQLKKMTAEQFFNRLAMLLKSNPPPASEKPVLEKLAKIGIVPGEKFDPAKLDPATAKGLQKSVTVAMEKLEAASKRPGPPVNGWGVPPMVLGNFGADYGARAVVALVGLGANLPQDAVYPSRVRRRRRQAAGRRQQVRHPLREGRHAAGERVLVGDDVRR